MFKGLSRFPETTMHAYCTGFWVCGGEFQETVLKGQVQNLKMVLLTSACCLYRHHQRGGTMLLVSYRRSPAIECDERVWLTQTMGVFLIRSASPSSQVTAADSS